ncbi:MAG: hypothetical protein RLZZ396_343 [Planctomycetota bacterium]
MSSKPIWNHSPFGRREALQIGAASILGLGTNHLFALQEAQAALGPMPQAKAKSCIFIFLSGGLAQHESFDMKPDAPADIRGEFNPISTRTPGLQICEHLPKLASISHLWSICRSLTHPSNDHSAGHHIMLTGQSNLPVGFNPNAPSRTDHPSIASKVGHAMSRSRGIATNNLPPAVVLPDRIVHNTGRTLPGQSAGMMGQAADPWFIEASPFHTSSYGAFPQYQFDHQQRGKPDERVFQAPQLSVPHTNGIADIHNRMQLLDRLNRQRKRIDQIGESSNLDRYRQTAASMMVDANVHKALDVAKADPALVDKYGRNSFGYSLLMARKLVDAGVPIIQVNLGNNETWDTHGNAFPHLKDRLLPPTDQALWALIDDLHQSGQLDETLIVMAGEFGRTAKITLLAEHYKLPGRDHWGAAQSVLLAGGGIRPGMVIGKTDAKGEYPVDTPVKPENFAATIYHLLGIPSEAVWHDTLGRPFAIYHGEPIAGLV